MIDVENLVKTYSGGVKAVRDVTFSVGKGDVVGFLGPNGAGKSTTMRILSGFISPSGGRVEVCGLDVTKDSLGVRKRLGYLPESCPLYPEMRVGEYLRYRAELKGVAARHLKKRVTHVMGLCDLEAVRKRSLGKLSKGFRQRVGIADALVHNPDLLILDEPTIGLDPNQMRQIRALIRDLASEHTILISTHILSEVEATCDRVLMLNEGKIVESGKLSELEKRWAGQCRVKVEVRAGEEELRQELQALEGVESLQIETLKEFCRAELCMEDSRDPREELAERIHDRGWSLRELHREGRSLEDVFVELTGGGQE